MMRVHAHDFIGILVEAGFVAFIGLVICAIVYICTK